MEFQKDTAGKLKQARKAKSLTQKQVAELMGIHWRNLQKIEAGEFNLTLETIERYCTAIGVRPEVVLK